MAPSSVASWDILTLHTKELSCTRAENEKVSGMAYGVAIGEESL